MNILHLILIFFIPIALWSHPLIEVHLSNKTPKQGDAVWIKVKSQKNIVSGTIQLNNKTFKLFKRTNTNQYHYLSCIGIPRNTKPKQTPLKFKLTFKDGSQYQTKLPLAIQSANFKKEHIKLKPKKYKLSQNKSGIKSESRLIGKKFRLFTPSKKFSGPFKWPLKGRVTSEFGHQRIYNNTPSWSHSGIDISGKTGAPIYAAQSGTVVLSKALPIHGKTVMINHGWGIISIYNHLHKLNVKTNDNLSKGDIIGTVGSTGIATGSHLHFGVSIQGVRINPKPWINNASHFPL
jgi:murein DD-endopeptidase MepM/ murein hydrolase activator NlpD